jgi:hypothetical protein
MGAFNTVAPQRLGAVQRRVGRDEQILDVCRVVWKTGNAKATGNDLSNAGVLPNHLRNAFA